MKTPANLNLVQNNINVRKSKECVQRRMDELGEGGGGGEGDGVKPPFPVKGEDTAHAIQITNHAFHPVML